MTFYQIFAWYFEHYLPINSYDNIKKILMRRFDIFFYDITKVKDSLKEGHERNCEYVAESYLLTTLKFLHLSSELLHRGSCKKLHMHLISKFIDPHTLFSYSR